MSDSPPDRKLHDPDSEFPYVYKVGCFSKLSHLEKLVLAGWANTDTVVREIIENWDKLPEKTAAKKFLEAARAGERETSYASLLREIVKIVHRVNPIPALLLYKQFLADIGTTEEELDTLYTNQSRNTVINIALDILRRIGVLWVNNEKPAEREKPQEQ